MMRLTPALFLFLIIVCSCQSNAQLLKGQLENVDEDKIYLYSTKGHTYELIDSTEIDPKGRFQFNMSGLVAGFYQLAVNDSDVVDIIINPKEKEINLSFSDLPLQERTIYYGSTNALRVKPR